MRLSTRRAVPGGETRLIWLNMVLLIVLTSAFMIFRLREIEVHLGAVNFLNYQRQPVKGQGALLLIWNVVVEERGKIRGLASYRLNRDRCYMSFSIVHVAKTLFD